MQVPANFLMIPRRGRKLDLSLPYFHTLSMRGVNAISKWYMCEGSTEPSLIADAKSTKALCVGIHVYMYVYCSLKLFAHI